jgi:hypothetical protein
MIILKNKHINAPITPIFFLSTGRTATQWLAWALNVCYPSVLAVHEPPPMIKPVGLAYHAKKLKFNDAVRACRKARGPNVKMARVLYKKRYYIECNHNLFSLAEPLRKAFPGCKIVGLVRDYKTFIPSMANRGYSNGVGWLKSDDPEIDTGKKQLAWYWKDKILAYINCADFIIDAEKLLNNFSYFNEVVTQIGFTAICEDTYYYITSIMFNAAKRGAMPNWDQWPDQDKQDVVDVIGQDFLHKLNMKVL